MRSVTCRHAAATLVLAPSIAAGAAPVANSAPGYPTKPIRIVVMSTAASGPDILSRLIGTRLTERWGQQVVIDNRPGASGNIGAEIAARATPDGHTLLMVTSQAAIVAAMFDKLNYDVVRDFTPVSLLASTPFILVVHPSLPVTSIKDLVAYAKSRPGELRYGSGGSGSPPHLAAEVFKHATGTNLLHVPYKGVSPALADTIANQIQVTISVVPMVMPTVKSGKVRALGVTSRERTSLAPDLPTIAESLPGYEVIGWYGLMAPARTPRGIVDKLNAELVQAVKSQEYQEKLSGLGAVPIGSSGQAFAAHLRSEIDKFRNAIKAAGIKPD